MNAVSYAVPDVKARLCGVLGKYYENLNNSQLNEALDFAVKYHGSQLRASGEPYYSHPVAVAEILAEMHMDPQTVITALLHDTVEDTDATLEDISAQFGPEIAQLVDGVTKLTQMEYQSEDMHQAENFRKLLLAISKDIRVLVVKLADRLHNMRTLHFIKKPEKRARIARETMDIYAPLAERVGMHAVKSELEMIAFKELNPQAYESIQSRLTYLRKNSKVVAEKIQERLEALLKEAGIKARVKGREKAAYSIWRKMQRKNITFAQLSDIMAFRIVVGDISDCYAALGVVHSSFHMVPDKFKDYISTPKANGYQSIHTVVMGPEQRRIEIQIRTQEMNDIAEMGVAAHWAYKQGDNLATDGMQYRWIRELLHIIESTPEPEEFFENTRLEMYQDQVFCFTPKGKLIALPKGATPVDFAYAVHTEVGNTCAGAKINSRIVPLRTVLQNGDQVDIICAKSQKPSPAWEKFVVTGKARSEIRKFIRQRQRTEYAQLGKSMLEKRFEQAKLTWDNATLQKVLKHTGRKEPDDLYAGVGEGTLHLSEVLKAAYPEYKQEGDKRPSLFSKITGRHKKPLSESGAPIPIDGLIPGMAVHFAGCCHPLPGEKIVGIINSGKGVSIHALTCRELNKFVDEPERWLDVAWASEDAEMSYTTRLKATLFHTAGSLATLANTIAQHDANISNLNIVNRASDFFDILLDVEVHDVEHLSTLMAALRGKPDIQSVERYQEGE